MLYLAVVNCLVQKVRKSLYARLFKKLQQPFRFDSRSVLHRSCY